MTAVSTACSSGKSLSWKVQESAKGMLIQLVWKPEPVGASSSGVHTVNWNTSVGKLSKDHSAKSCSIINKVSNSGNELSKKKRISPS